MPSATSISISRLERRWRRLSLASRRLLTAVALHGEALPEAMLAALASEPEAVDELVAGKWLQEQNGGGWILDEDAATVGRLAPWSLRRAAHLALASWHARQAQGAAKAAGHFEAGGLPDEAGRCWLSAARAHCRRQQHRAAARSFTEAIRLMPETLEEPGLVEAVRDFGVCAGMQPEVASAIELLQRWRERPGLAERLLFQAEAAAVLAGLLGRAGRHVESAGLRRLAAHYHERSGHDEAAAGEWLAAATTLVFALHLTVAKEAAVRAIALGRACERADVVSQACTILGLAQGMMGETSAGRESLETALDTALKAGLTTQAADAYRVLGNVSEYASCYHDEQRAFNRALSYCRRHDEDHISELCLGCYSYSLFRSGNWRRSLALAKSIVDDTSSSIVSRCVADGVLGLLFSHRGEVKPAIVRLDACLRAARQTGIVAMEFFAWWGLALAREVAGELVGATEAYSRLLETWKATEDRHDAVPGLACAVTFHARRGDLERAAECASALQRIATINPNPEMVGAAAQAAAELDLAGARPAEAVRGFGEALRCYQQRDLSVEWVRVRLRLGVALAASGDIAQARRHWKEARLRAGRLGARPLAALVAGEERALALGSSTTRQASTPAFTLSPRQNEVARHLSAGRTNKEMASLLGLSVRTVDMHVAHLLARLDCRTRAEAAAKLSLASVEA